MKKQVCLSGFIGGIICILMLGFASLVYAEPNYSTDLDSIPGTEKIEGRFVLKNISKLKEGFRLSFVSKSGVKFFIDTLNLHYALKQKDSFDLEALVVSDSAIGADTEVFQSKSRSKSKSKSKSLSSFKALQVLVNLRTVEGTIPVWILDKDEKMVEIGSTRYLKMHAPSVDYRVF